MKQPTAYQLSLFGDRAESESSDSGLLGAEALESASGAEIEVALPTASLAHAPLAHDYHSTASAAISDASVHRTAIPLGPSLTPGSEPHHPAAWGLADPRPSAVEATSNSLRDMANCLEHESLDRPATFQAYEKRIFHLEQALDQALTYLTELNGQVKDQTLLEEKLASTEEYAYVQYQAIARLQEQVTLIRDNLSQKTEMILSLEAEKTSAQMKLSAIEQAQAILKQEISQWQHACQELQQECDRQHRKMATLEDENAAMQEQILQQARQSNEHETAIQYWKDQYNGEQHRLQLLLDALKVKRSEAINAQVADMDDLLDFAESLGSEQLMENELQPPSTTTPSLQAFNLPDFLIRRYRYRSRKRSHPTLPKNDARDG